MGNESSGPDMTATFRGLDRGEAGMIVTMDADIADWADRHGYIVRAAKRQSRTVYEISPGDDGLEDPTNPVE